MEGRKLDVGDLAISAKANKAGSDSYRVEHTAPSSDLPNATNLEESFPDIYSRNGLQYYGTGMAYDSKAINAIKSMRTNPNKPITVYRAVPNSVNDFESGDWITTTREYAIDHIGNDDGWHVISKSVKPNEINNDGNSIHEFGYNPK
jgi:hypothetical protein